MTNQSTFGENDSESVSDNLIEVPNHTKTLTLKAKIEALDANLCAIDATLGIDCAEANIDISGYLQMSRREIESLTPEVAATMAHEINLSIFHLQKTINRNMARLNWCKSTLNGVFGQLARDYSHIYGWEEKKSTIIYDDTYAERLYIRTIEYQSRVDSLYNITDTLKGIAGSLKNIQYLKTSRDRNNNAY